MLHIIQHFHQLQSLIIPLSDDYAQNIGIHICNINHRDILCCQYAESLHDGSSPGVTIVYIPATLLKGARIIVKQLRQYFPNQTVNNPSIAFMFKCPGCGIPFSKQ